MITINEDSNRPTVKYEDLEMACSFVSDTHTIDAAVYICRKTGKIFWDSFELDDEFDTPNDVDDCTLYASVPDQCSLNLGKRLVFLFIEHNLPEHYDQVSAIFRRRGAYSLYKDFLHNQGKLEDWYAFENSATETALRNWAQEEGFAVEPSVTQKTTKRIYQFRIELKNTSPVIWRCIQVPETYTFWDLHVAIQDVMGWLDYHLHAFRMTKKDNRTAVEIGIPDDEFCQTTVETLPSWKTSIVDYFHEVGVTADYEYDFGDGWLHEVVLKGILLGDPDMQYPLCIGGERACPPEDCGGVPGYNRLLRTLSTPDNEEHKELLNWLGRKYDPDEFTAHEVKFDEPKARWEKAFLT